MAAGIESIVVSVVSFVEPFFHWVLRTSIQTALVVALVLLLRRIAAPVLSPRWRHALWALVLLRAMLPTAPHSPFSMMHAVSAARDAWSTLTSTSPHPSTPTAARPDATGFIIRYAPLPSGTPAPQPSPPEPQSSRSSAPTNPWLIAFWLLGVLLLTVRLILANITFRHRCERTRQQRDERLWRLLDDCRKQMRLPRAPSLWITDAVRAPAVTGLFRPRLLLPLNLAHDLSDAQLRLVFLHELAHVKCRDIALEWLWTAVNVMHWFNPMLWLARPRWRADRELARDAMVLSIAGAQQAESYGQMILRLVQAARDSARPMLAPGTVGMADVRQDLRRRITMIARFGDPSRRRRWMTWGGFVLLAVAGCAALTDPPGTGLAKAQAGAPTTQKSEVAEARQAETRNEATISVTDSDSGHRNVADAKALAALDRNMPEINFSAVPFADCIDFLRDVTNVNIFVNWKALEASGVDRATVVSARLRDVKFSKALKMILKDVGGADVKLGYEVDDGVITISTEEDLAKNVVTRVYDIRDLIIDPGDDPLNDFVGAETSKPGATSRPATQAQSPREQAVKLITQLLQDTIAPDSWKDKGGAAGSVRELSGQLIITQNPENQSAIELLLRQLRENRGAQVTVESRFLSLDPQKLKDLSPPLRQRLIAASGGSGAAAGEAAQEFLSPQETDELLRAAQNAPDTTQLFAPRLTLFNGQRAYVMLATSLPYVASFAAIKAIDGKPAYEPQMKDVQIGLLFDVQATITQDHRAATVLLRPTLSRLDRMLSEPAPGVPPESQLFVQRPVLTVRQLRTATTVPDGSTLLVGGFQESTIGAGAGAGTGNATATQPIGDPTVQQLMNSSGGRRLFLLVKPTLLVSREQGPAKRSR
jgi:beta-lactamase regulating signal transducer with metallopeptidase domain/type II secretory pathway component GspD/PulD (secretin)